MKDAVGPVLWITGIVFAIGVGVIMSPYEVRGTVLKTDCASGWSTSPIIILNTSDGIRHLTSSRGTCVSLSLFIGKEIVASVGLESIRSFRVIN